MTKELIISVVALLIAISAVLVGNGGNNLGGTTASSWIVGGNITAGNTNTGTTTLTLNKVCFSMKDTGGTSRYIYINPTGNISTSSTACN